MLPARLDAESASLEHVDKTVLAINTAELEASQAPLEQFVLAKIGGRQTHVHVDQLIELRGQLRICLLSVLE